MTFSTLNLTFEEYLNYDDETDNRYEYEDGRLLKMPPAKGLHEEIISFLSFQFQMEIRRLKKPLHVRSSGLEIETVYKKEIQSRKPDISVITKEQKEYIRDKTAILPDPPPLVVEVVSPGKCIERDYERKRWEYEKLGISEYWIVDPIKNIVTLLLLGNDGIYQQKEYRGTDRVYSVVFPELNLTADEILAGE